jgi:CDP-glucose 4,6-dehydratase
VVSLRNPGAIRPWQHVLEPLSGYLALAIALGDGPELHGEPFNFGPSINTNHSVGELASAMAKHWDKVRWEELPKTSESVYESSLLKLNCDKALHQLQWHPVWDFKRTVKETALWYKYHYSEYQHTKETISKKQIEMYMSDARSQEILWAM